MTTYTKSLVSDFGSSLQLDQFHTEIEDDTTIITTLQGVNLNGDVIDIVFDSALSGGESTQLDILISNHTPIENYTSKRIESITIHFDKKTFSNIPEYELATRYLYPGTNITGQPKRIRVIAHNETPNSNSYVRIYCSKCKYVIAETSVPIVSIISTIYEVPLINTFYAGESLIVIQYKTDNETNEFHLEELLIDF